MFWKQVKNCFKPTATKILIAVILVSFYVILTLYQALLSSASTLSVVSAYQSKIDDILEINNSSEICTSAMDINNARLLAANLTFSQFEAARGQSHLIQTIRNVVFPGTGYIELYYGPSVNILGYGPDRLYNLDRAIRFSPNFFPGLVLMFGYFYLVISIMIFVGRRMIGARSHMRNN